MAALTLPRCALASCCQAPPPALSWPTACHRKHSARHTRRDRSKPEQHASCNGAYQRRVAAAAAEQAAASSSSADSTTSAYTATALANLRYTSPDGQWVVRPLDKYCVSEVRRVVALQTDAFHTSAPLPMLDDIAKRFFEAEVLSEMQKKLKFNPDDLFVSLVIEPAAAPSSSNCSSHGSGIGSGSAPGVVGVVEISYIASRDTLALLEPGTAGYCYIASMVVAPGWRRRGAAAALLTAAEIAAAAWDEQQTLLHVYQDNEAAVQLYRKAGYEVLHQQKKTLASFGVRPRYLMRKRW